MTERPVDYDAELHRYGAVLRRAWAVQSDDRVLDLGCGAGQTTRQAAGMAPAGSALGVDVSAPAIARAREITRTDRLSNVTFECADAQIHSFAPGSFDVAISRFGTMFFDDPVAAFTNIGRALHRSGRLVMAVWQTPDRNEWDVVIRQALAGSDVPAVIARNRPDPFWLADPPTVEGILQTAGFTGIGFTDVRESVYYGPDAAAALAWVRGFTSTTALLEGLDQVAGRRALARLLDTLASHQRDDGVWFQSRAWIVTAHRQ
jgi:SAM-dependent methyltransferase